MAKMKAMASKKSVFAFIWSSRGRIKAEIYEESSKGGDFDTQIGDFVVFWFIWLKYLGEK